MDGVLVLTGSVIGQGVGGQVDGDLISCVE